MANGNFRLLLAKETLCNQFCANICPKLPKTYQTHSFKLFIDLYINSTSSEDADFKIIIYPFQIQKMYAN